MKLLAFDWCVPPPADYFRAKRGPHGWAEHDGVQVPMIGTARDVDWDGSRGKILCWNGWAFARVCIEGELTPQDWRFLMDLCEARYGAFSEVTA